MRVQAVASLLMGFKPDAVWEQPKLEAFHQDPNRTWPYPPVLLLQAENDQPRFHERIDDSMFFLQQQVCWCSACMHAWPRCAAFARG